MRLATYDAGEGPRAGVVAGESIHDAATLLGTAPLRDVGALLELDGEPLDRLRAADLDRAAAVALSRVRLHAPLLRPPSVRDHIAFEEHASRSGTRDLPEVWRRRPLYYYSGTGRVLGPDETVPVPLTERLDYELELAAVVGRQVDGALADPWSAVAGFTLFNDWSARDLQADEMAYGLGPSKGKDFASSFGPWMVTTDELMPHVVDGRLQLSCTVRVNGEIWAESDAGTMYHSWPDLLTHAAYDGRLVPGDLLGSGTVGGCSIGEALRAGTPGVRYLEPGDRVELEVEAIGTLASTIGRRNAAPPPPGLRPPLPPMPAPRHDVSTKPE